MQYKRPLISVLLALIASNVSYAQEIGDNCLQDPNRTQACPHTIIKRSPVDVPVMNVTMNSPICICLADFAFLNEPVTNDVQRIARQTRLRKLTAELGVDQATLERLISYR
ncbi:hypothetical protein [Aestuariibacter salexigens]|uniref:hypothetical protein n=1 Tax=Aestuariibacter salexigens TaxID=226010 RepID=UPI00047B5E61|nr:hypothetical protein [Aestuariibacter salexigens]